MPAQFFKRWFAAILLTYAIGFCVFYLNVFTASDESLYVEQAMAFATGSIALRDGATTWTRPSRTADSTSPCIRQIR